MVRLAWIDQLVTSGLVNKKKLPYARIVLSDPDQGIKSMIYRDVASEIFTKLSKMVLSDQVMFQRALQLLKSGFSESAEVGSDDFLENAKEVTPGQKVQVIKKLVKKG